MLDIILGNNNAVKIMLHIYHYGEIYPTAIAKDYNTSLSPVQKQLEKFENSGILISKLSGKTRVYSFNKKNPLSRPFI